VEANWRGKLEANWRQIGGELEANWRQIGGKLLFRLQRHHVQLATTKTVFTMLKATEPAIDAASSSEDDVDIEHTRI
jgi:hypothetical protein